MIPDQRTRSLAKIGLHKLESYFENHPECDAQFMGKQYPMASLEGAEMLLEDIVSGNWVSNRGLTDEREILSKMGIEL